MTAQINEITSYLQEHTPRLILDYLAMDKKNSFFHFFKKNKVLLFKPSLEIINGRLTPYYEPNNMKFPQNVLIRTRINEQNENISTYVVEAIIETSELSIAKDLKKLCTSYFNSISDFFNHVSCLSKEEKDDYIIIGNRYIGDSDLFPYRENMSDNGEKLYNVQYVKIGIERSDLLLILVHKKIFKRLEIVCENGLPYVDVKCKNAHKVEHWGYKRYTNIFDIETISGMHIEFDKSYSDTIKIFTENNKKYPSRIIIED